MLPSRLADAAGTFVAGAGGAVLLALGIMQLARPIAIAPVATAPLTTANIRAAMPAATTRPVRVVPTQAARAARHETPRPTARAPVVPPRRALVAHAQVVPARRPPVVRAPLAVARPRLPIARPRLPIARALPAVARALPAVTRARPAVAHGRPAVVALRPEVTRPQHTRGMRTVRPAHIALVLRPRKLGPQAQRYHHTGLARPSAALATPEPPLGYDARPELLGAAAQNTAGEHPAVDGLRLRGRRIAIPSPPPLPNGAP